MDIAFYPILVAVLAPYGSDAIRWIQSAFRWVILTVFSRLIYHIEIHDSSPMYNEICNRFTQTRKETNSFIVKDDNVYPRADMGYHLLNLGDKIDTIWVLVQIPFMMHKRGELQISPDGGRHIRNQMNIYALFSTKKSIDAIIGGVLKNVDMYTMNVRRGHDRSVFTKRRQPTALDLYEPKITKVLDNLKYGDSLFIHGPPGTGKSLIVQYLINKHKISSCWTVDERSMWATGCICVNCNNDSIIVFDEFEKEFRATIGDDSLVNERSKMSVFLTALDDIADREKCIYVFICNEIDTLKKNCPAFFRKGRMTHVLHIDYPKTEMLIQYAVKVLGIEKDRAESTIKAHLSKNETQPLIFPDLEELFD